MPVAPTFTTYNMVTEKPFNKNGKLYVTVCNPKTNKTRDVRWYTDAEYAKAYGNKAAGSASGHDYGGLKAARGFSKGPILVVRNNTEADEEWLGRSVARYATDIGWYFVSTVTFPDDAPAHLKYLLLSWEEFRGDDDNHMKSHEELKRILDGKAKHNEWFNIN